MDEQQMIQEHPSQEDGIMDILQQLPISEEEMQTLADNGFDDIESLKFLDINTLLELGINQPEQVFEAIQEVIAQFQEYSRQHYGENIDYGEEEEEGDQKGDQEEGQYQEQEMHQQQQHPLNIEVKPPKVVTTKMIVQTLIDQQTKLSKSAAMQQSKTLMGVQLKETLQKLSHLQLNNKKIQRIGEEMEQSCKNLKVIYLFDNMIDRIEGLTSLKNLIQLSLYNNQIMRIEGLEGLTSLRKLYLEKNHIDRLEGLTGCRNLEELYLSGQNTETEFTFDDYSLAAISGSLRYLDLGSSNVVHSKPLYYLERLEVLILKRNRISDFEDDVVPMLQTLNSLRQLDLSDNPVNQIQKYRDQIIILTGNRLSEIDNKAVSQQERKYLMQLVQRKQRTVGTTKVKEEKKGATFSVPGFEIQGKNKELHATSSMHQFQGMMATGGAQSYGDEDTQNHFYSPIDDGKGMMHGGVLKARATNIANSSYQNNAAMLKKRTANLNSGSDFTGAGLSYQSTKHIPQSQLRK